MDINLNRPVLFYSLTVGLICGLVVNAQTPVREDKIPIENERLLEISKEVAFDGNFSSANARLSELVKKEFSCSIPDWFLGRINRSRAKRRTQNDLAKPVFRFSNPAVVNISSNEGNRNQVEFAGNSWKIVADSENIEFLGYREMGRSDYFIAKKTAGGLVVAGDQPDFPIAMISEEGEQVWLRNIYRKYGYSRVELEIRETKHALVCFMLDDDEFSIQSFSKKDGSTEFWWSSSCYGQN